MQNAVTGTIRTQSENGAQIIHAAVFGGDSAAWAASQAFQEEALRLIGDAGVRPLLAPALADGLSATRALIGRVRAGNLPEPGNSDILFEQHLTDQTLGAVKEAALSGLGNLNTQQTLNLRVQALDSFPDGSITYSTGLKWTEFT